MLPLIIRLHTWCENRTGKRWAPRGGLSMCLGTGTCRRLTVSWNLTSCQDLSAEPALDLTATCPLWDAAKTQLDFLASPPLFLPRLLCSQANPVWESPNSTTSTKPSRCRERSSRGSLEQRERDVSTTLIASGNSKKEKLAGTSSLA